MPILGLNACVKLNFISKVVKLSHEETSNDGVIDTVSCCRSKQSFLMENKSHFEGIGTYPGRHKIELKENIIPVVNPNSKCIISKVDKVTDWVYNNPYYINKCIKTERFPIPTVDKLRYKLTGKQWYTAIDMKDCFHEIELDEDSKNLYERLPKGVSSARDVFQRCQNFTKIFGCIEGVGIYFYDMIIATVSEEEHVNILKVVLERAKQYSLQYKVTQVKCLGTIFDADGVRPDLEKVESISRLKDPANKKRTFTCVGVQIDASQFSLGACLLQNSQPAVTFASRSLTESEEKYPQIGTFFLAICFALDKFHEFVYG
ncbi:hypothetical protein PR048_007442 [Dryococelus australis]|uniref:Reverse transcriptase/retrotransposon-derived protein RNase H-like domain-containing protein n=1 Tax=Dryococelus australis TaxID=614101 RepID=A0ABQ9HU93_9NEOP|nr:hypothetical protein PR048_007442 [Dryococelus australis]